MKNNSQPIFYHYTSQQGLIGILKNREIWATHIQYLNDSSEFQYAVKLAKDMLKNRNDAIGRDLSKLVEELFLDPKIPDIFVTSFSALQDDLGQWRAYCPKLGGFNIGFDKKTILSICKKNKFTLAPCEYSRKKQEDMINNFISLTNKNSGTKEYIDSDETSHDLDEIFELIEKQELTFALYLLHKAAFMKHPKFKNEKEYRLAILLKSISQKEVFYREGHSMIMPYLKIKLTDTDKIPLPIKRIIVGPTPNRNLVKKAIEKMILAYGISSCEVLMSKVPYRPW